MHIDFIDYILLLLNGIKSIQNEVVPWKYLKNHTPKIDLIKK